MTFPELRRRFPNGAVTEHKAMPDGHAVRVFEWPQPAEVDRRGSLLWLGGRGDVIEKYFESFGHWHARGWHVTSFDWRGQGGSGRLLGPGAAASIGHIDDFATWLADLRVFWSDWVQRTPAPHVLAGHSMGGHLVLRALVERLVAPDAAVLVAPMLGFEAGPLPQSAAARVAALLGRVVPERSAWKTNERPGAGTTSRRAFLTSDVARYDDELWWKAQDPSLALGPPSWGWMAAAYRSFPVLARAGMIEAIDVPVLVLGTEGDKLVSPRAIRRTAARLARGELHMWDVSVAHEILRERDVVRDDALARIDAFLERTTPA